MVCSSKISASYATPFGADQTIEREHLRRALLRKAVSIQCDLPIYIMQIGLIASIGHF